MFKRHKKFISVYIILIIIGLFVLYKMETYHTLRQLVLPVLLLIASIPLLFLKMKDKIMKLFMIIMGLFTASSMYALNLKDEWYNWFGTFIALSITAFIPLLLASTKRNYDSMGMSIIRKHPWLSGIIMASGFLFYRDISTYLGSRELPVILLIAIASITMLMVTERHSKVRDESFYSMLIGSILLYISYGLSLKYIFGRTSLSLPYWITITVSLAGLFLIISALEYDEPEI